MDVYRGGDGRLSLCESLASLQSPGKYSERVRKSTGTRPRILVAGLLVALASAAGCATTVDGAAICIGCGNGTEPDFGNARPGAPTSMPTPVPLPPSAGETLSPNSAGYVYIETKSGKTRCQLSADNVGCESDFADPPTVDGEPANGVEVSAGGSNRWVLGNLGAMPTTTIGYATYAAVGWTIEADSNGTRFTNDQTGHGMFISTEGVEFF